MLQVCKYYSNKGIESSQIEMSKLILNQCYLLMLTALEICRYIYIFEVHFQISVQYAIVSSKSIFLASFNKNTNIVHCRINFCEMSISRINIIYPNLPEHLRAFL